MDDKPQTPESKHQPFTAKFDRAKLKVIGLISLLLLSTSAGFLGGWLGASSRDRQAGVSSSDRTRIVSSESELINDVVEDVGDSVVSVNVISVGERSDIFGFTRGVRQQSAGTGVILSEGGVIVTNRHVVPAGATAVSVTLANGTELENVEVIGRTNNDDPLDIAFLKVTDREGEELKPARLGDSGKMEVGEKVIAIGNALGQFQNTVTSGIISGYGRNVVAGDETSSETLQNLFQTDAAINQGNSGGPLVNIKGEVIGINTAVAGGGAENIGFAIPINDIKGLISSVLETGELKRPFLGIRYVTLNDEAAEELGLDVTRGAYIVPAEDAGEPSIIEDSPAEAAGLQEGDVITKVEGTAIDDRNSLTSLLGRHQPGDKVTLTVRRDGGEHEITVTLGNLP